MRELASAVVLAAFENSVLSKQEQQFFRSFPVSGVTLFRRNIPSFPQQLHQTLRSLHTNHHYQDPMIVAIDQEGGRVSRMPAGFPDKGAPFFIEGSQATSEKTLHIIKEYGREVAAELLRWGINVNFAPVLDILTKNSNVAIGDRAWGARAEQVTIRAGAFLAGMQDEGLWGCLKHFPGQGHADADTHLDASRIHVSKKTLENREIVPFRSLIAEAPMVMISHCIYTDFDDLPASLSPKIQKKLLKQQLSFNGLILSDDMNMKAISQDPDLWVQRIEQALVAGSDLILICRDVDRIEFAISKLGERAKKSLALRNRLYEAVEKINRFRRTLWRKNLPFSARSNSGET